MRNVGKRYQSARCLGGRQQILAAFMILGSICALVGARIDVNETGLHGGEGVYGLTAPLTPDPYVNAEDIALFAWGETNPSLYANVWFSAYGISANTNLTNTGAIGVTGTGGNANADGQGMDADAQVTAHGIYTVQGLITNSGQIDVTASAGTASARLNSYPQSASASAVARGLYTDKGAVDNSGKMTVTAQGGHALADGTAAANAAAYGVLNDDAGASNRGDIAVTAVGGTADTGNLAEAKAQASGLTIDGAVDNSGNLAVTATAGTARSDGRGDMANAFASSGGIGITAQGLVNNSGNVGVTATSGTAEATSAPQNTLAEANAGVTGIYGASGVTNSGNVTVTATAGTASNEDYTVAHATAYGVTGYGTLVNSGNVTATATGGTANSGTAGAAANAEAKGLDGDDLNNTGEVTVIATGGTASTNEDQDADASSYAQGLRGTNANNTGAVSVTAAAGTATGANVLADAEADGIIAGGNVLNSGAVTVTATAPEGSASLAYGIRMNSSGNLTNTGVIRTIGNTAYELYVTSGTTTLVDTYNVTLDGDPNRGSLAVADGATLALNNARLSVTGITGETLWNTPYSLFDIDSSGVVDGNFASVQGANPNTTVTYYDQGTAGRVDDAVSLAYTPVASPALASAAVEKQVITQAADVVNNFMTVTLLQNILSPPSSGLLVNAGSTAESLALAEAASDKTDGVFVEPYYSQIDQDADPLGYDASLWGFAAGYERFVESTLLSLHLGYGQSDIEYTGAGYKGNSENQEIVTGGFGGLTRWDLWTLRYGLTGFYGLHDYQGLTGLALDEWETANYDSYGTVATLMLGRILQHDSHVFLPEVGVNWLWVHRERYTTEATDPSWDTTYSATDDYDLHAAAALRWLSSFVWHDLRVSPSVSLGVRHLLTDAETSARQSVDGSGPVLVESRQDRTAMTLSGSLVLTKTRHAVSLAYDGDYSSDAQRHSFWLRYSWLF